MNPNGKGGFQPGETGNAGGRPRSVSALQLEARKHTLNAINTLAMLMEKGEPDSTRVAAAREILDRGFGKSPVAIDLDVHMGKKISELNLDELAELERKLAASAALPALTFDGESQAVLFDDADSVSADDDTQPIENTG